LIFTEKNISSLGSAEAVKDSDLVVEAIIESLKVKGDLFKFLDGKARYVNPSSFWGVCEMWIDH
jgi:3-hydroxyacyl-CoA dehydrogenase